jgi:hypothetical protein
MSVYDDLWRLSTAQALAVASVGGAAASSSVFGTQTYAVQLAYPGSTSSTAGCGLPERWRGQLDDGNAVVGEFADAGPG